MKNAKYLKQICESPITPNSIRKFFSLIDDKIREKNIKIGKRIY